MHVSSRTLLLGLLALGATAAVVVVRSLGGGGAVNDGPEAARLAASPAELTEWGAGSPATLALPENAHDGRTALRSRPVVPLEPDAPRPDLERLRADGAREKEFYAAYRWIARESPAELTASAHALLLRPDASDPEKIAMLRAVHVEGLPAFGDLYATAIVELSDVSPRGRESVPSFAVRFLGDLGTRDPRAREVLERAIWPVSGAAAPAVRRRAAAYLGAAISEQDLARITVLLARDPDRGVVEAAVASIAANPRTAHREIHREFGLPPLKVVSDAEDEG
jgi:hypothetical protein